MHEHEQGKQATQKTLAPKPEDQIDIPIPKKRDFFQALKNAIKKPSRSSRTIK
jgi:hypothetical protein